LWPVARIIGWSARTGEPAMPTTVGPGAGASPAPEDRSRLRPVCSKKTCRSDDWGAGRRWPAIGVDPFAWSSPRSEEGRTRDRPYRHVANLPGRWPPPALSASFPPSSAICHRTATSEGRRRRSLSMVRRGPPQVSAQAEPGPGPRPYQPESGRAGDQSGGSEVGSPPSETPGGSRPRSRPSRSR